MNAIIAFIVAPLIRVSPFVLKRLAPIFLSANAKVWKAAYPVAVGIVRDLMDNGHLDGLDKHKLAVKELETNLVATGRFAAGEVSALHLGQIILAAYAEQLGLAPATAPTPIKP
jgi:hypothetical protein